MCEITRNFITKQYLAGACCYGYQNFRFDNTFGLLIIKQIFSVQSFTSPLLRSLLVQ